MLKFAIRRKILCTLKTFQRLIQHTRKCQQESSSAAIVTLTYSSIHLYWLQLLPPQVAFSLMATWATKITLSKLCSQPQEMMPEKFNFSTLETKQPSSAIKLPRLNQAHCVRSGLTLILHWQWSPRSPKSHLVWTQLQDWTPVVGCEASFWG